MTTVAVIGDSIMAGYTGEGYSRDTAPCVAMAARLGWTLWNWAEGGAGYLRATRYRTIFDANMPASPDVALIAGTSNDLPGYGGVNATAAEIAAEAGSLYAHIAATLPNARLIVTAPMFQVTSIDMALYAGLIAAMKTVVPPGATWIDPITDQWITAANRGVYLSDDTLHPRNVAVQPYLGTRLASVILYGANPVFASFATEAGAPISVQP